MLRVFSKETTTCKLGIVSWWQSTLGVHPVPIKVIAHDKHREI